ncbi:hepatic lectin-like [Pseudophryne corroboree]|uniref:hepatic lectin-like n=1 Tax=Pseudophryne corroboree TaxID=495146 RepID=UPI0030817FFF
MNINVILMYNFLNKKICSDNHGKTKECAATYDQTHLLSFCVSEQSCEPDWLQFDGSCYYLSLVKSDWHKARSACTKKGADLAVITSEREQIFLTTKSAASPSRLFWIGLHDSTDEGAWEWVDGTNYESSYKSWKEGEPNDHYGDEDCAHMWTAGEWNDALCSNGQRYAICEKKL